MNAAATLSLKTLRPVFTPEQIARRVREIASEIDAVYGNEPLVAVCVLKGAVAFFSDLTRSLHNENLEVDFVRISSYGREATSSRHVVFSKDVEIDICDKHVLVVEDIIDSGHSMHFLLGQFAARRVRSLRLAVLIDKGERREVDVPVDFVGFTVAKGFLVGYGLDYAERFRMLPGIYERING